MKPSLYNRVLISFFTLLFIIISFFIFWIEPYNGDLCRIGGYRENDYGWNIPQKRFRDCHFTIGRNLSDYDRYYDIVTIGDSFSVNQKQSWQNHLALTTGAKILTFHRRSVTASSLLQYEQFIKTPPKVFIFQVVEHGIQTALFDIPIDLNFSQQQNTISFEPFDRKSFNYDAKIESFERDCTHNFSMESALHYIKTNLKQLFGSRLKAKSYELNSDQKLFSNNKQNEALFFHLDDLKLSISANEWAIIEKRFATLQYQAQANGKTCFLAMIAPDKTTVYNDFIEGINQGYKSSLEYMPKKYSVNWINLEEKFKEALSSTEAKDLYLPNDIHWGYEGYKLAFHSAVNSISLFSVDNE